MNVPSVLFTELLNGLTQAGIGADPTLDCNGFEAPLQGRSFQLADGMVLDYIAFGF